jgi:hypothetical protein
MSRRTGSLIVKDPQSIEPQIMNWTDWLAELSAGETISVSTWAITGTDAILTYSAATVVTGSLKAQLKLTGGTVGVRYTVTNHIVTTPGNYQDDRSFFVLVEQR